MILTYFFFTLKREKSQTCSLDWSLPIQKKITIAGHFNYSSLNNTTFEYQRNVLNPIPTIGFSFHQEW